LKLNFEQIKLVVKWRFYKDKLKFFSYINSVRYWSNFAFCLYKDWYVFEKNVLIKSMRHKMHFGEIETKVLISIIGLSIIGLDSL